MKSVVLNDIGRQVEFKPNVLFEQYLKLVEKDVRHDYNKKKLTTRVCPACHSKNGKKTFKKFGFQYIECQNCNSVYISPHPTDNEIKHHYLNSNSGHFLREKFSKATIEARKEKIYLPRLQWMTEMMDEYFPQATNIADLCNKNEDFVLDFLNCPAFNNKIIVNPYFEINKTLSEKKKVQIINDLNITNKNKETVDLISAFEVIDYTINIDGLFGAIKNMLVHNGLCFLTTISISGFDLQVLWENSNSIFPFDRINVFSMKGLNMVFKRHGFELLEYSTPGLLDLDIVKNAMEKDKRLKIPRFVRTLIDQGDEQIYKDFQEFLQINRLSSFVRILLRKT